VDNINRKSPVFRVTLYIESFALILRGIGLHTQSVAFLTTVTTRSAAAVRCIAVAVEGVKNL